MKDFTNNDKLFGVACDVVNCRFHGTDNYCHADEIVVESENALRKAETFCGTFTPKGASSM
jgi:hypothetical protein